MIMVWRYGRRDMPDFEERSWQLLLDKFKSIEGQITEHNTRHEQDLHDVKNEIRKNTDISERTLEQATNTNGTVKDHESRLKKLERVKGKHIPTDPKTLTIFMVAAIIFMVLVVGGIKGLESLKGLL